MDYGSAAAWISAFIAFLAINAATVRWLLDRRGEAHLREANRVDGIQREINELKIALPLEYVRRDDWIRFSSTIDAKLDRMREEMREDLQNLKVA